MSWGAAEWLLSLPLVVALYFFSSHVLKNRPGILWPNIRRFDPSSAQITAPGISGRDKKNIGFWLGMVFLILALARPQWGSVEERVFEQSREIMIALDLSRSMLASDVRPSRLDRSKLLVESLLAELKGERVGLLLFSGTAFVQCPLSSDYEVLKEMLPALNSQYLPEGGTDYRQMLEAVLRGMESGGDADRYLIVLSDGESLTNDWRDAAKKLIEKRIRVIGLGVGTQEGAVVTDQDGALIKDERGAVVLSRLESRTLEELAKITDGIYQDASQWLDLHALLKKTVESGQKGEYAESRRAQKKERYQWVLALALLCGAFSLWREFPAQVRRRFSLKPAIALFLCLCFGGWADATAAQQDSLPEVVQRLSSQKKLSAGDCAEMAAATIKHGKSAKASGKKVERGAVEDALMAVDRGERADPGGADWARLRAELKALLDEESQDSKKDDSSKKKDKNNQKRDEKQSSKQDSNGQKGDQKEDSKKSEGDSKSQDSKEEKSGQSAAENQKDSGKRDSKSGSQDQASEQKKEQGPKGDEAGWDANRPPEDKKEKEKGQAATQKVGGKQKESQQPVPASLVEASQRVEQVRQRDNPAQLFQILEGHQTNAAPKTIKGKNW